MSAETANPYVGLRPFGAEDVLYFFGRREQTAALLGQLHASRFLAVVGSSGCGKSSLLQAGLIPALEGGFLVEERDRWVMFSTRPGDGPVRALAQSLCRPSRRSAEDEEALELGDEDATALLDEIRESWAEAVIDHLEGEVNERTSVLLVVDQFEEIFRFRGQDVEEGSVQDLSRTPAERARRRDEAGEFVDMLLELSRQSVIPIYVVISMRSDFLGDCDVFYGLPEAMNRSRFLVPRLTRNQTRQAIEGPAQLVGARLEAKLVDRLLNELGDRTDRLPVLQHALMRTFDLWRSSGSEGEIAEAHYIEGGGLRAALSNHAEEALAEVNAALAEKIFKCLTDTDPLGRRIRRPQRVDELVAACSSEMDAVLEVVDRFHADRRSFLWISSDRGGEARVDISHESLIRVWERLHDWAEEEAESAETYTRLAETARRFEALGAYLLGPDLASTLAWREEQQPSEPWAARYDPDYTRAMKFLDESRDQRDAQQRVAARRRRMQRWTAFGALVLALALVGLYAEMRSEEARVAEERLAVEEERNRRERELIEAERGVIAARKLARDGDLEAAVEKLRESTAMLARYATPVRQTRAMREESVNLALLGRFDEAEQVLDEALQVARKGGDEQEIGRVIEATAMLMDQRGDAKGARAKYEEALEQFGKSRDQQAQGRVFERLGVYERAAGQHDRAAAYFESARNAYQLGGDTLGVRRSESQLTQVLPWGYITNLLDRTSTPVRGMDGKFILTGRGTSNHINSANFTNMISRWHIVIERLGDGGQTVADMRSTNGSSLNGIPLRYAHPETIESGDVFTLAGEAVFLFTMQEPPTIEPPLDTWGLLVSPAGYHYLTGARYDVAVTEGGVNPATGQPSGMAISWDGTCAWIHNPQRAERVVNWLMETDLQRDYEYSIPDWGTYPSHPAHLATIHDVIEGQAQRDPKAHFQLIQAKRPPKSCMR